MLGERIICTAPGVVKIEPFKVREIKNDEVLIKIKYTVISNGTEKARLTVMPNTHETFPYVPGYSGVGIVEKVGSSVTSLSVGDRVFVSHGGHASYNIKGTSAIVKIPDRVEFLDAVFTKLASFPMHAIRNVHLEMGESVVIVGFGALGLLGIQLAKIAGALPVIGVGNREVRQKLAKNCGADYIFSPNNKNLIKEVIACCKIGSTAADVVIETSGSVEALSSAIQYMSKYGRISLVGCNRITDRPIDLYQIHLKGLTVVGSNANTQKKVESCAGIWTGRRNFITLLGYMEDGRLQPRLLKPIIVNPHDAVKIYNDLVNDREFPIGVVFDWGVSIVCLNETSVLL